MPQEIFFQCNKNIECDVCDNLTMITMSLFSDCCHQRSFSEVQTETRSVGSKKQRGETVFSFYSERGRKPAALKGGDNTPIPNNRI